MAVSGIKKVLLALDGSEESMATVNYVSNMIFPTESSVSLFHVFSRIPETYWDFDKDPESDIWMKKLKISEQEHEDLVNGFMDAARQVLMDADFREQRLSVEIQDRVRGIARDIIDEAQKNYGAVIMGRTGSGKLSGPGIGSVTTKVLASLTDIHMCIVSGQPALGKILVAIDGSEGAMRALNYLCDLKGAAQSQIILFHAMRHIGFTKTRPLQEIEKKIWEDAKESIEPTMAECQRRLINAGIDGSRITVKIVTGVDSRAGALINEARQSQCGTIMVGRTGVSQVEDFNIGRVTHKVIHQAEDMAVWVIA